MPADDSPAILVARYLWSSGYEKTLAAFLEETGIDEAQIAVKASSLTLESLLEEKRLFDLSLKLETILTIDKQEEEFSLPYPSKPIPFALPPTSRSSFLFVTHTSFTLPQPTPLLIATTASPDLHFYDITTPIPQSLPSASSASSIPTSPQPFQTYTTLQSTPILACCVLGGTYLLTSSMSGTVAIHHAMTGREIWRVRDHTKYVVKIETSPDGKWFATAGYDKTVNVYHIQAIVTSIEGGGRGEGEASDVDGIADRAGDDNAGDDNSQSGLKPELAIIHIGRLDFLTNPEAILFVPPNPRSPILTTSDPPLLIVSRRDCTILNYYSLPSHPHPSSITLLKQHNLTDPITHTYISFTPMCLSLHPTNPTLLAIATDSVPVMKFLLIETYTGKVLVESFTGALQSAYSNALLSWRPDGTGVWVNSDDGVVRGIEARSGKVVAELKNGHKGKVRTLWSGWVPRRATSEGEMEGRREVLVTGGFDHVLNVWEVRGESDRESDTLTSSY